MTDDHALPHPLDADPAGLTWTAPEPVEDDEPGSSGFADTLAVPRSLPPIIASGPTAARWSDDLPPAA